MKPDILSTNLGTIITIEGQTRRGIAWLRRNVSAAGLQSGLETGCDCDHRYGVDILQGALAAGLTLQDANTGRIAKAQAAPESTISPSSDSEVSK